MGITSLSGMAIQPTKPKTISVILPGTTQNTWNTVLSSTSGRGILTRVSLVSKSGNFNNSDLEIRITIDGTQHIIDSSQSTTNFVLSRAFSHQQTYTASNGLPTFSIDYLTQTFFKQSIQVEVRNTWGAGDLDASVDYAIE